MTLKLPSGGLVAFSTCGLAAMLSWLSTDHQVPMTGGLLRESLSSPSIPGEPLVNIINSLPLELMRWYWAVNRKVKLVVDQEARSLMCSRLEIPTFLNLDSLCKGNAIEVL